MIWAILAQTIASASSKGRWTVRRHVLAMVSGRDLHSFRKVSEDAVRQSVMHSTEMPSLSGKRALASVEIGRGKITFSMSPELLSAIEISPADPVQIEQDYWLGLRRQVAVTVGVWAHADQHRSRHVVADRPPSTWEIGDGALFGNGLSKLPRWRLRRDVIEPAMLELTAHERAPTERSARPICSLTFGLQSLPDGDVIRAVYTGAGWRDIDAPNIERTILGNDTTKVAKQYRPFEMRDRIADDEARRRAKAKDVAEAGERRQATVELAVSQRLVAELQEIVDRLQAENAELKARLDEPATLAEPAPVLAPRPQEWPRPPATMKPATPRIEASEPEPFPRETADELRARLLNAGDPRTMDERDQLPDGLDHEDE